MSVGCLDENIGKWHRVRRLGNPTQDKALSGLDLNGAGNLLVGFGHAVRVEFRAIPIRAPSPVRSARVVRIDHPNPGSDKSQPNQATAEMAQAGIRVGLSRGIGRHLAHQGLKRIERKMVVRSVPDHGSTSTREPEGEGVIRPDNQDGETSP